jgi:hypothetical protein
MNAMRTLELIQKYNKCPVCGSDKVGNGAGKLIVEEYKFYRSCKYGWEVETDEYGNEVHNNARELLKYEQFKNLKKGSGSAWI